MDEISIDRLVLDIPGLTAVQARELGHRIGAGLASASTGDTMLNASAGFDALAVDLNELPGGQATDAGIPRLAEAIVSALLTQIGGR